MQCQWEKTACKIVENDNQLLLTKGSQLCLSIPYETIIKTIVDISALHIYFTKKSTQRSILRKITLLFPSEKYPLILNDSIWNNINSKFTRPKNLLIIVNPYSGFKKGRKIFYKDVKPLLKLAGIRFAVRFTEYPKHAQEIIEEYNISEFDGIICMGGDGTFNEVLTKILMTHQNSTTKIKMGLIPTGSMNALNLTTSRTVDVNTIVYQIICGHHTGLDVIAIKKDGNLIATAHSNIACGFLGETLSTSEKLRFLGPSRYLFAGINTFIKMPVCSAEVKFEAITDTLESDGCQRHCKICKKYASISPTYNTENSSLNNAFSHIQIVPNACCSRDIKTGVAPKAHHGDGVMDVLLVESTSSPRKNCVELLTKCKFDLESRYNMPCLKTARATNVLVRASYTDENCSDKPIVWNCDGELLYSNELELSILCQAVKIYC